MLKGKSGGGGGNAGVGEGGFVHMYSPVQAAENRRLFRLRPTETAMLGQVMLTLVAGLHRVEWQWPTARERACQCFCDAQEPLRAVAAAAQRGSDSEARL